MNNGLLTFYTQDTVASVDLYIMAPGGRFVTRLGVTGSRPNGSTLTGTTRHQVAMIPFSIADSVAATEGHRLRLARRAMVLPDAGCSSRPWKPRNHRHRVALLWIRRRRRRVHGGKFLSPAAGAVLAKSASTATRGALIGGGTATVGPSSPAVSIGYTLSSGTTVAKGFAIIPYQLPIAALIHLAGCNAPSP